jgi:nitric oxide reductase NorQ protein
MRTNKDRKKTAAELRSDRLAAAADERSGTAQHQHLDGEPLSRGPRSAIDQISPRPESGTGAWSLTPRTDLFENPQLASIGDRAMLYLNAGISIHLRGPAGTGKTTIAMQLAARIGRPAVLLTGDDGLTAGHLAGREIGMKSKQVVDRYVHSVHKVETETTSTWSDAVLTC